MKKKERIVADELGKANTINTNKQPFGYSRNLTESFLVGIIVYQSAMAVIIPLN